MSLNRYEWLLRAITFHDHNAARADFLEDKFFRIRWFLTEFEKKMRGCITGIQNLLRWMKLSETFMRRIIVILKFI